jgi:nitrogen fixation protein
MTIQKTIDENIFTIFDDDIILGEICQTLNGFEVTHKSGYKLRFSTFEGACNIFKTVKPKKIETNQLNLF